MLTIIMNRANYTLKQFTDKKGYVLTTNDIHSFTMEDDLQRLLKAGLIEKLDNNIYHKRRYSDFIKCFVSPNPQDIINAISRRDGVKIIDYGHVTANELGICNQVPAKLVYYTSGNSYKVKILNWDIKFIEFPLRKLLMYRISIPIITALLWYDYISDDMIKQLSRVPEKYKKDYKQIEKQLPDYMRGIFK